MPSISYSGVDGDTPFVVLVLFRSDTSYLLKRDSRYSRIDLVML